MKSLVSFKGSELESKREINWHFNPPKSYFSGAWKRLVQLVKNVMSSFSIKSAFIDEGLATLFVEVQTIVYSRPLFQV